MNIPNLLSYLYPNAIWTLNGEDYDGLVWHDGNEIDKPTEQELKDAEPEFLKKKNLSEMNDAVYHHIRNQAISMGYHSCVELVSFKDSSIQELANDATSFSTWRDAVWGYALTEFLKFENEERALIPIADFINELPQYVDV